MGFNFNQTKTQKTFKTSITNHFMKETTLKEIANTLGISITTVSKALKTTLM